MTFRTVLNKVFSGYGVVLPLSGDMAQDHDTGVLEQPKTSQSEIVGLFAEELRGRHPIHNGSKSKRLARRERTN